MREREPMIQTMNASRVRQEWSKLLTTVFRGEKRVIVEKSGIPVAAIISTEDLERLKQFEAQREERWKVVDDIRAKNRDKDPEEVERDIAEELAAMRIDEAIRTLSRDRIRRRYDITPADIAGLRALLEQEAVLTALTVAVHGIATHPEDDLILATALSGQADYLVTGDRQLLKLGTYHRLLHLPGGARNDFRHIFAQTDGVLKTPFLEDTDRASELTFRPRLGALHRGTDLVG